MTDTERDPIAEGYWLGQLEKLRVKLQEANEWATHERETNAELRAENEQLRGDAGQLSIDLSVALAENERLRAALEMIRDCHCDCVYCSDVATRTLTPIRGSKHGRQT